MQVLVVRHAIAHERNARRWPDDGLRPLTRAGASRFRKAARGVKRLKVRPQRMLSSPLVRAWQTAEVLAETAQWPEPVECPQLEPQRASDELLAVLRKFNVPCIAIVGHEPALSRFIAAAITRSGKKAAVEMKKGAIACLTFSGHVRAGGASLSWLIVPRMLRALAR